MEYTGFQCLDVFSHSPITEHVKKFDPESARHLDNDLRLAHAARASDVQGHKFTD